MLWLILGFWLKKVGKVPFILMSDHEDREKETATF